MSCIHALYSKDAARRAASLEAFVDAAPGVTIHILPKNRWENRPRLSRTVQATYEDLTSSDTWLHLNSLLGETTSLVLENPARYPKAMAPKSRALRRLSMQIQRKLLVDIVPFTMDIQHLYTPLSFLSRGILGYAHHYAFADNHREVGADGQVYRAHDPAVLAPKLAPICDIDYPAFLSARHEIVTFAETDNERDAYAQRKTELFAKETNLQRIITRLADTAHAFGSRQRVFLELCQRHPSARIAVYTNLASYAKAAHQAARKAGCTHVSASSYQIGAANPISADVVVYLEPPIVNSYYLLDIEASHQGHTQVYWLRGETGVDCYLSGEIDRELRQINELTQELYHVRHR